MKYKVYFNNNGIKKAADFFEKNHKNYSENRYFFNINAAIDEAFMKSSDSESNHYELSSIESKSGSPEVIHFKNEDYVYQESESKVNLSDVSNVSFYKTLLINNITKFNKDQCGCIQEFLNYIYSFDITLEEAVNESRLYFSVIDIKELKKETGCDSLEEYIKKYEHRNKYLICDDDKILIYRN